LALGPALAAVSPRYVRAAGLALAAVVVVYAGIDVRRCRDWRTPVALFESAVHAYPRSARAHMELASAYGHQNLLQQALAEFDRALAIKPDYAAAAYNKGNLLVRNGQLPAAVEAYQAAVQANPALTSAWYNLGLTYQLSGDPRAALGAFERARALAPYDAGIAMSRADVLLGLGRWAEAVEAYTQAIDHGGPAQALLINRGVAKQRLSGCAAALPDYLAATEVAQPLQAAFAHAVACLDALGRGPEARALEARGQVANGRTGR
jgi:protein O-GlcNAc transferase